MDINLFQSDRVSGSYPREFENRDVIDSFYKHKGLFIRYSRNVQNRLVLDWAEQELLAFHQIDDGTAAAYRSRVLSLFLEGERSDTRYVEQLDDAIQELRCECFGVHTMEQLHLVMAQKPVVFDPEGSIDQRSKKKALLQDSSAVIFVCNDPHMFFLMREDVLAASQSGKDIFILANDKPGMDIPCEEALKKCLDGLTYNTLLFNNHTNSVHAQDDVQAAMLNRQIRDGKAVLFYYGEMGLLFCRDLLLNAVVHMIPWGYYARALTNQFDTNRPCVIFVPKGLDITKWAPLREKTRLDYHLLFTLWTAYGDGIYAYTPEQLYRLYPQHFLNVYSHGARPAETTFSSPIRLKWKQEDCADVFLAYDALREQAIAAYLNSVENLEYRTGYFDEDGILHPVTPVDAQARSGVMVHSVKVKKAVRSGVIQCEGNISLHRVFEKQPDSKKLCICSNFLFFLTPVLARLYNSLRKDRPREQIDFEKQSLDYMLVQSNEKRTETFPLFRKACIAMKKDGTFLFFNFRLGGGRIRVGRTELCWNREDVDPKDECDGSVYVFTPYLSNRDLQADAASYTKPVGESRINLVIIQDRIICIRKGSILLPSIGVVISLDEQTGKQFIQENGLSLDNDGYAESAIPAFEVHLDPPEGIPAEEWTQVEWAYGGGLSLMLNGKGICDQDGPGMQSYLEEEGWMSPLSRQTRESALHVPQRHPRTAIGTTKQGDLVILVYSGRTKRSGGADYAQMLSVARKLYPELRQLMNADGGGSAMLGMALGREFMELSYPSTSLDSCVGMARPINTALCIEMTE